MRDYKVVASWFYVAHNEKGIIEYRLRNSGVYGYHKDLYGNVLTVWQVCSPCEDYKPIIGRELLCMARDGKAFTSDRP